MKFILLSSLLFSFYANAATPGMSAFVERLRPYVREYLGSEIEVKLLGEEIIPENIPFEMPLLPKITENATSIEVFNKKEDKVILAPEVEAKFYVGFIKEAYEAVRGQKPNDDEISKYYNVLNQGGTREGIYRSLVLDETYAGLENMDAPVNVKQVVFAEKIYQKFLGKNVGKDKLQKLNIYTLKRFVSERALEIIDGYESDRESLEKWYAYLSHELAKDYAPVFSSNIRKEKDLLAQKNWASKVPVQHLKSEAVIKLHLVFNKI